MNVSRWPEADSIGDRPDLRPHDRRHPAPFAPAAVAAAPERIDECRRTCSRWRSCMRDYQDCYMCQEDLTRSCRECRDQGLGH